MSDVKFPFTKDFQRSILRLMLTEEYFCSKAITYLQDSYFENIYLSWVFSIIKRYYKQWNATPSPVFLKEELNKIVSEERQNYKSVVMAVANADVENKDYIKIKLTDFIRLNRFKIAHSASANLFNNAQFEKAYRYTQDQINEIRQVDFVKDDIVEVNEIYSILDKVRHINVNKIPIGIPVFDQYLEGGIPKQSVTTIIGGYNSYKTSMLINCAYHAARMGKKVIFIFHEGRREQILSRFLSRITLIPYNKIISSPPTDEEKVAIDKAKEFLSKYIIIKPMRKVGVSVEDVYDYVKFKMKEFPCDMLVCDYGQKLNPRKRYSEKRHNQQEVWDTFDLMSAELDIAVLTAAQFNREGHKQSHNLKIVRSVNVSECIGIAQVSETIFTINPYKEGQFVLCLDKQRDGRTGKLVLCEMNMSRIITHDPELTQKEVTLEEMDAKYE